MAILIAYYSRAGENYFGGSYRRIPVGNTRRVAEQLASLTGKLICPFCTHEGSGLSQTERDIRKAAPGATAAQRIPHRRKIRERRPPGLRSLVI